MCVYDKGLAGPDEDGRLVLCVSVWGGVAEGGGCDVAGTDRDKCVRTQRSDTSTSERTRSLHRTTTLIH